MTRTPVKDAARLQAALAALSSSVGAAAERWLAPRRGWLERPEAADRAANLAAWLALRQHDLAALQDGLSSWGLSSLGRSESRVLASLAAVTGAVAALTGQAPPRAATDIFAGDRALERAKRSLFGPDPGGPSTRILVTLPAEAAARPALIGRMVAAGADCFRINCAHDDPEVWARLVAGARRAGRRAGRHLPLLMDLGGPKLRIAALAPGKSRRLEAGDRFLLAQEAAGLTSPEAGLPRSRATLTLPQALAAARPGAEVWIDDGKLGATIERRVPAGLVARVIHAKPGGSRLKPEKGVNLPGVELSLPALTALDLEHLDFVAAHADLVGLSFVQRVADVEALQQALAGRLGRRRWPGLVLKIETRQGLANLPDLVLRAAGRQPTAIMLARGDLAIELGFEALSAAQEEVLSLAAAARLPVIWATQVAEGLLKTGRPSRPEITDLAMAQRAECVMLNKGPHVLEAIAFADRVLRRMDRRQRKRSPRLAAADLWRLEPGPEDASAPAPPDRASAAAPSRRPRRDRRGRAGSRGSAPTAGWRRSSGR